MRGIGPAPGSLLEELLWREIPNWAVGPNPAVFQPPRLDSSAGISQAHEPALVWALVAELPVEALHEGVLHGLTRLDEVELDGKQPEDKDRLLRGVDEAPAEW
jgi:hypothetical protein